MPRGFEPGVDLEDMFMFGVDAAAEEPPQDLERVIVMEFSVDGESVTHVTAPFSPLVTLEPTSSQPCI